MGDIKVSVIIPVYNMEKYVLRCLNSVVNQTLKDIEIICINDGSTDDSLEIILECAKKDNRIKVIDKINTGYGNSMNIGIEKSTGEYIGIVESDDFILPDMYERLYKVAFEQSAEIVKANYYNYTTMPIEENKYFESLIECKYDQIVKPLEEYKIFYSSPSIWSAIYSKNFLDKNKIRFLNTEGASYQDTSFYFKTCFCAKRMFLIKDAFLFYWLDNENSSVNNPKKVFCVFDELNEIKRFLSTCNEKNQWEIGLRFKFQVYMWNYNRLSIPYQYAFLIRAVEEFRSDIEAGFFNNLFWTLGEAQAIQQIISDFDTFFQMTTKYNLLSKMQSEIPMNLHLANNRLGDLVKQFNTIIIYGAGKIGKNTARYLQIEFKIDIKNIKFALSDENNQPKQVNGISVSRIDTLSEYTEKSIVIVAVRESLQLEILLNLKRLGFHNYYRLENNQINNIYQWYDRYDLSELETNGDS